MRGCQPSDPHRTDVWGDRPRCPSAAQRWVEGEHRRPDRSLNRPLHRAPRLHDPASAQQNRPAHRGNQSPRAADRAEDQLRARPPGPAHQHPRGQPDCRRASRSPSRTARPPCTRRHDRPNSRLASRTPRGPVDAPLLIAVGQSWTITKLTVHRVCCCTPLLYGASTPALGLPCESWVASACKELEWRALSGVGQTRELSWTLTTTSSKSAAAALLLLQIRLRHLLPDRSDITRATRTSASSRASRATTITHSRESPALLYFAAVCATRRRNVEGG
jgi:hypothetical protein